MHQKTDIQTDVAIVGGGLIGPLLALALEHASLSSTIIDLNGPPQLDTAFDGRAYALNLGTRNILQAVGLWSGLKQLAQPIVEMKISEGCAGEGAGLAWLHVDHAAIDQGPLGYLVEDRHLRSALVEASAAAPHIRTVWRERVVQQKVREDTVELCLEGGGRVLASVLVGCDGRLSGTARRAGIGRIGWDYDQGALVSGVSHERPHQGIAHQLFTPEGPLAILPLRGNRSSIVWTDRIDRVHSLRNLDHDRLLAVLRPRFGDFLGEIALEGRPSGYPLSLSIAERMISSRLVLAGDAAHGIHPLAGQGLNLGARDIATLAEVLVEAHRQGSDIGALPVLRRYEQWRRADSASLALVTDGINRVFCSGNPFVRIGRALGIHLLDKTPALCRGVALDAMGVAGDLPKLQRGRLL